VEAGSKLVDCLDKIPIVIADCFGGSRFKTQIAPANVKIE